MKKEVVSTDKAPGAIGPYSQAVKCDCKGFMFCSGQIPIDPESGEIVEGGIKEQTRQVLKNLFGLLEAAGMARVNVVKTTVYLKSMDDFAAMNEVYASFFEDDPPARAAVEVARLPKDVMVEIEAVACY